MTTDVFREDALASLTQAQRDKLAFYARLVLEDENAFHRTSELIAWIDEIRESSTVSVEELPVNELRGWYRDDSGAIRHESGEFFSVIGLRIGGSTREVSGWDQPIVRQKEAGVLGILVSEINGVDHYLLHAKAEPGNTLLYQISPTLQATYSNLRTAHGGRKPRFAEFFEDGGPGEVLYRHWLAEDGGRFYLKSNLNMLVRVPYDAVEDIGDEYRWFTLSQIKELLGYDDYINPHVRGILCHL